MRELWDFEGVWQVARSIDDARSGQQGGFDGTARFERDGEGLHYLEQGVMELGGTKFQAERRYLWRTDDAGIAVFFDDGRPFHTINDTSTAAHWCDPDQYDVTYDFDSWPVWTAQWRVQGPRKDYVMVTTYRR